MNKQDRFDRFVNRFTRISTAVLQPAAWHAGGSSSSSGAGVTGSILLAAALRPRGRCQRRRCHHAEQGEERDLHSADGRPQPHRHVRFQDVERHHARHASARDDQRHQLGPRDCCRRWRGSFPNMAIVRSMRARTRWCIRWRRPGSQIGRNPAAALGNIAPNIGSVVAIEKDAERAPGQVFPTFLALNSPARRGPGYLSAKYAPFKMTPNVNNPPACRTPPIPTGQADVRHRWQRAAPARRSAARQFALRKARSRLRRFLRTRPRA